MIKEFALKKRNMGKIEKIYIVFISIIFVLMLFNITGQNEMSIDVNQGDRVIMNGSGEWKIYTPELSLRKGKYTFDLEFADTSNGAEFGIFSNNRGGIISNGTVNNNRAEMLLDLTEDAENLRFAAGQNVNLKKINIKSNSLLNTDVIFGAVMLLLFGIAIYLARFTKSFDNNGYKTALILTFLGLSVSMTSFLPYVTDGHDIIFHLMRITSIKQGLMNGQFPVRNYEVFNNGYGSVTGIMYPDLFLYIPALLKILGVSTVCAYNAFIAMMNIGAAFSSYYSVKTITKSQYASILAAIVYTTSLWRLENILLRAAIGEALGMVFFPVIIAGIYHILRGDKKRWYVLAIGMTGMINSHILSVYISCVFCVVMCCVFYKDTIKKDTIIALLKAAGITIVINLWYLVPFLSMSSEEFQITNSNGRMFLQNRVAVSQLFNVFNLGMGYAHGTPVGNQMGKSLGVGTTIYLLISVAYFVFRKEKRINDEKFMAATFLAGLTALWMSTTYFPWEIIFKLKFTEKIIGLIQFSWRLLSIVSAIMCITGAAVIAHFCKDRTNKIRVLVLVLAMSFLGTAIYTDKVLTRSDKLKKNIAMDTTTDFGKDYAYKDTDIYKLKADLYESDKFNITETEKKGLKINMTVEPKNSGAEGQVKVPLSYYPGYTVKDKNGNKLEYVKSDNNVLAVELPSGYSGEIKIRYTGKMLWRFADIISLISLVATAAYIVLKKKNKTEAVKKVIIGRIKK